MPQSDGPAAGSTPPPDQGFAVRSTPEDVDALCASLADPQRRELLRYVAANPEPYVVEELAQYLSTREVGGTGDTPSKEAQEAVMLSLHHNHLPRLAEAGVLDVDRATNTVLRDDHFDVAKALLDVV